MAKDNFEKTVIVLEETEVQEVIDLSQRNEPREIFRFVTQVIAKKVESASRRRCA